jgi:hypothetical protein
LQLWIQVQVLDVIAGAHAGEHTAVHAILEAGAGMTVCAYAGMVQGMVWVLAQFLVGMQQWMHVPVCEQVPVWMEAHVHILVWL